MRDYTQGAIDIAKEAGALQLERVGKVHQVEYKGERINLVTEVDRECEKLIVGFLKDKFPGHDILSEEGGGLSHGSPWRWIVDPLDGTVNFTHGYPLFAVSIALEYKGSVVTGCVYEPNRDELFVAEKGGGVVLNDRPIRVSKTATLGEALLATGFAYNVQDCRLNNLDHFSNFVLTSRAVRRDGVASTNLCYVACGRFDGFWELYLKSWDIAAGALICEEAGGRLTGFDGTPLNIHGDEIVASNGLIHERLLEVLKRGGRP